MALSGERDESSGTVRVQNIQHFLFLCVSGGSRAARIASSNTFFSPRYDDRRGKRTRVQLAQQTQKEIDGRGGKRNMAGTRRKV